MDEPDPFQLAECVAEAAQRLGIETALIGAMALAANGYVRATADVDIATMVDPRAELHSLQQVLRDLGYCTDLSMPDDEDVLGGVLRVWRQEDEDGRPLDLVEVVNFNNPYRPRPNPAAAAIKNAVPLDERTILKYVRLPDLVALKLYAGGRQDLADIGELLVKNRDANLDEIRLASKPYDRGGDLERLIAEASLRLR